MPTKSELNEKKHYFNLSFLTGNSAGKLHIVSHVLYSTTHGLTNWMIQKAKKDCGIPEDAVLISASYLGLMAEEEFMAELKVSEVVE